MVDFVPSVLRSVFEIRMSKKYKDNWKEYISTEDVYTGGNDDEKAKLESKDIENWDGSLLAKMLLKSRHFLLVGNNEYKVDELDSKSNDISWKEGDEVLIQKNATNIHMVKINGVKPFSFKVEAPNQKCYFKCLSKTATISLCTPEWKAVNRLRVIRNTKFAHCPRASIENNDLQDVVADVKECCEDLGISDAATKIDSILSGMLK